MATLYESYITGDDTNAALGATNWFAQTFTPSISHNITSVKLKLTRFLGFSGDVVVSIRATDADSKPTGSDLASGTTTVTTLGWYEITLGAGTILTANTKYAIVARAPTATGSVYPIWRVDATSATYTGGGYTTSSDSGVTWTAESSTFDFMFEDWGDPTAFIPKVFIL